MAKNALVKELEQKGRGPDTILAHITPEEAQLLKDHGGSGTINPETGLPEFLPDWLTGLWDKFTGFVRKYAPIIMPAVAIFAPTLIPSIGTWLGATTATGAAVLGSAALSAGVTFAAGGSLKDVLTSAALAGATTYLTPVIGQKIAGAVGVTSPVTAQLIGTAATSGGLAALRGGTVKEVIAAAATGAASSYLAGVARDAFAGINNGMASGKISANVTQKGAEDSVFLAADAANLKAAGLTEAQVVQALKDSGANGISAELAAKGIFQGKATADVAANVAASMPSGSYSGSGAVKSITAGNNLDLLQRIEDSQTIGQDAAQLKAQGLSQAQIKENLMATGVSEAAANTAAYRAASGYSASDIASAIQTGYKTTPIYSNTDNVVSRDLGQAMTTEQQDAWRAQPYKAEVDAGKLTVSEAAQLSQNGYKPADVAKLTSMGYTGADLVDMASTGVTASTLTGLGDTTFAETNINDMLKAGASINDISYASKLVGSGKLSTDNAQKLLLKDYTGNQLYNISSRGDAVATKLADANISSAALDKMLNAGWDLNRAATLSAGGIDVNKMALAGDATGFRNATLVTTLPVEPVRYASSDVAADIDFALADAKSLRAQGLNESQISQVLKASGMSSGSADYLARGVQAGYSDSLLKTDLQYSFGGKLYGVDPAVAAAQAAAAAQAKLAATVPEYKAAIDANKISVNDAVTLKANGYSPNQVNNLLNLGYTSADLVDLASTGVKAPVLLGLGNTAFDETKINDMLKAGVSINDIRDVSDRLLDGTYKYTTAADAEKALMSGQTENNISVQETRLAADAANKPQGPTVPVKMPDGTVGSYDPATGDVLDANGTKVVTGTEPTPGTGTDVAGPYRVDISGVIADDNMSATVRAQHLKGAIPDGTVLANSQTPGAYVDQASNAWVVRSGPTQITQPIEPVEITPGSRDVTTVDVTPVAPTPVAPTEPPPTDILVGPGNIVAPPGTEIVYDELGNTYFFNNTTGEILDNTGKVIYTPPAETPAPAPTPTPPAVTQPEPAPYTPPTPPPGQQLVSDETGKEYFFDPETGRITDTTGVLVYEPPVETPTPPPTEPTPPTQPVAPTQPVTPPPPVYTPPSSYVPITGEDGKDYYFDPDTGKVVDTDGKTIYTPPTTPAPPTTEPPVVTPPVGPVSPEPPVVQPPVSPEPPVTPLPEEPPLKPLPREEIPPTKPIPEIQVPVEPPVEPPVLPPIIPPVVVPPETPGPKVWDPINVSFKTLPLLPNPGLNPGFIQAQPQYQTTSPVQSQYYWGQHPYQSGGEDRMTFDPALYKQVPAPVSPWGLQELYTPTNIAQYLASLQGPVKP